MPKRVQFSVLDDLHKWLLKQVWIEDLIPRGRFLYLYQKQFFLRVTSKVDRSSFSARKWFATLIAKRHVDNVVVLPPKEVLHVPPLNWTEGNFPPPGLLVCQKQTQAVSFAKTLTLSWSSIVFETLTYRVRSRLVFESLKVHFGNQRRKYRLKKNVWKCFMKNV